ncbi:MAG TPA: LytTR family DNA-binding domain-containing protein [Longimicrobiales bacterium]|nr:LytTR family DNA-binding domain-containing protein [Longimicrobiales bacterium]
MRTTTTIRALIVDDEPFAREGIRLHLERHPDVEVVGEAGDGERAAEAIRMLDPDVVFLDIEMPEMDGFEVIEAVGVEAMPPVIFITAYDEFALRAFETHALDYVLKPVEPDRFARALDRARTHLRGSAGHALDRRLAGLMQEVRQRKKHLERVVVQKGERLHILLVEDVDWLEAAGNYVKLHVGGDTFLVRATLTSFEERLDPEAFLRVHRSIIVQKARIRELEPLLQGDYVLILADGTRLTTGRSFRSRIVAFLHEGTG